MLYQALKGFAAIVLTLGLFGAMAYVADPSAMRQRLGLIPPLDVPYVESRRSTVAAMLDMADVGAKDYVIDLGTGDGRILIAAARDRGASGLGVDLDPALVEDASATAARLGLQDRIVFAEQDLFDTPLGEADVVTMFLLPDVNLRLRPRLLAELAPGARVVSNRFDMGAWRPDETRRVAGYDVHLWTVPARIAGAWSMDVDGQPLMLRLAQNFQDVRGMAVLPDGTEVAVTGLIEGSAMRLTLPLPGGQRSFQGQVERGSFVPRDPGEGWSAERAGSR